LVCAATNADGTGDPLVVMSGATIDDSRYDFSLKADYFGEKFTISPNIGYSTEKDYKAVSGGVEVEYETPYKATSVRGGVAASFDEIDPTQLAGVTRVNNKDKDNFSIFGGLTQVINKYTVIQTTLCVSHFDGFLSDPCKQVWVAGSIFPDSRQV